MAKRSTRRRQAAAATDAINDTAEEEGDDGENGSNRAAGAAAAAVGGGGRSSVPAHVRDRQRAVAQREAARLARPEKRVIKRLGHADRKKSAVTSTPFGVMSKQDKNENGDGVTKELEQEWSGPFAVARQMIAKREEARRRREQEQESEPAHPLDQVMEEVDLERKRKLHPSLQWKGKVDSTSNNTSFYAKRQKRIQAQSEGVSAVPTLFDLCVRFLVDNFEHVEALGDVDNSIRCSITKELVAHKKLNGDAFKAIAEEGIEALEMVDCAEITQEQLASSLKTLLPSGLRYLVLGHSGRCCGPKVVEAIISACDNEKTNLFALSVGGAYLLSDADAARLVQTVSKTVSSLEFKACPGLGAEFCKAVSQAYSMDQRKLLELSLEDQTLADASLADLVARPAAFANLQSLSLRRIEGMDDLFVPKMLEAAGKGLERLDLSHNYALTDTVLSAIRKNCPRLRSLQMAGCTHLTAAGLEALFTHVSGMDPPPMLTTLNLSCCDNEAVTDEVMELVVQAATLKPEDHGNKGVTGVAMMGRGLVHLDIQGSTVATDTVLERLAASCGQTLQEVNVSFCPKFTDKGLGYFVDTVGPQLHKLEIWGCAQLTDEFFDGHNRVDDPNLQIVGAWMKNNSIRTIR